MFKKLVEKLKKWLTTSAPKQSNPIAAKFQEEAIKDLVEKAEAIAEVADETAKDIEKEIVEAVKEVKKRDVLQRAVHLLQKRSQAQRRAQAVVVPKVK